jgi:hypothetical protein
VSFYEDIREAALMVGGHHERNRGAGRVVEVVMDELTDVTAGATAENDNPGSEGKQQAIGERD